MCWRVCTLSRFPELVFAGAVMALVLPGCTDARARPSLGVDQGTVVGGEISDASDDGVVFVDGGEKGLCSGALIAPNLVMTTLHCIAEFNKLDVFSCQSDGTLVSISSPQAGSLGALRDPSEIVIRTGVFPSAASAEPDAHATKLYGTKSLNICQNDLGLILLDRELALPLIPLRFERPTKVGEATRVVGYGWDENEVEEGRHHRDDVPIQGVGTDGTSPKSPYTAPKTLAVGEGPCKGDSGSPLIAEATGAAIGVCSVHLSQQCIGDGVRTAYTQVAPFETLIRQAFKDAGFEPLLEQTESGEGGAPGAAGAAESGGEAGSSEAGGAPSGVGGKPSATGGSSGSGGGTSSDGGTSSVEPGTGGVSGLPSNEQAGEAPIPEGHGSGYHQGCAVAATGSESGASPSAFGVALLAAFVFVARRRSPRVS